MTTASKKVRFVCISDTHNKAPGEGYTLPKGDVLVHAGDLTNEGSYHELKRATEWIENADFVVKIVVAGNHDLSLDQKHNSDDSNAFDVDTCRQLFDRPGVHYLQHSSTVVELRDKQLSFRVFGSPYSAHHPGRYTAFQYQEAEADALWDEIPAETDVLITHTPSAGICDASEHYLEGGSVELRRATSRVRPALHVCGHCHEGRGAQSVQWRDSKDGSSEDVRSWEDPGAGNKKLSLLDLTGKKDGWALRRSEETAVVNASMVVRSHQDGRRSFNKPIVVDLAF